MKRYFYVLMISFELSEWYTQVASIQSEITRRLTTYYTVQPSLANCLQEEIPGEAVHKLGATARKLFANNPLGHDHIRPEGLATVPL
ncbi:hypothetical protein [Rudanella paleaurantiibacter]|uniref:hypothetical protein n=1 Tax=Rudanella paleaurantiibacter TaxID=2614655 RepID=UPI00126248E1|nr:hypothetical protein [Rudanella paleaurantiibacter]